MKAIASFALFAVLLTSPASFAQAPGPTGGGSTTAPTSGAIDSGTIDRPGTGKSTITPDSTQTSPAQPPVTTGVAPSGATVQSTTPPRPAAAAAGRTVGQSSRGPVLKDPKLDPVVRESEQEVSKRIKNICKGC